VGRQDEEHAVADTEPPAPAGLGDLSASLRTIADFLEIDKDLMAVAAETSRPSKNPLTTDWPNGSLRPPQRRQPPRKAIESRAQPGEPNVTNIIRRIEFRRLDS
jgi:hypothetical protein